MNVSTSMVRTARRILAGVLGGALLAGSLAACSGGSDEPADASPKASAPASTEPPYLEVPAGVELTARGSAMKVGQTATVAWQPAADQVGALEVTVTTVEKAPIKVLSAWQLDKATKRSQPYFVRAKVTNRSAGRLDQVPVPLYAVAGNGDYLSASTFDTAFRPCPSQPLPRRFKPGASARLCWVYLAPHGGKLTGVSFYPGPWFDPIVWTGPVTAYRPSKGGKA